MCCNHGRAPDSAAKQSGAGFSAVSVGGGDRRYVANVGAAAAAENADLSSGGAERNELTAELRRIAIVQLCAVVQLGVTEP